MRAEKFIKEEIKDENRIIRIYEIKEIKDFDFDLFWTTVDDVVGDDYEALYDVGISFTYSDDWVCIEVDKIIDKFKEYEIDTEDETYTQDRINTCMKFLNEYKGFTIYNTN
jgi:hypothetical protein